MIAKLTPTHSLTNKTTIFSEEFWTNFRDQVKKADKNSVSLDKRQTSSKSVVLRNLFEKNAVLYQSQLSASLLCDYACKDLTKAYELIQFFNSAEVGDLVSTSSVDKSNKNIKLAGAQNWGLVMCYLDSLFFSMFAKLHSFEPLLLCVDDSEDLKIQRLRGLLRLYVSLMRSGNLITCDITRLICMSLQENGFEEAMSRKQEDSCQLFIFLTELLKMPLLTLKIDIAHGGKEVEQDDHRYTKERMLYVSIPEDEIEKIEEEEIEEEKVDKVHEEEKVDKEERKEKIEKEEKKENAEEEEKIAEEGNDEKVEKEVKVEDQAIKENGGKKSEKKEEENEGKIEREETKVEEVKEDKEPKEATPSKSGIDHKDHIEGDEKVVPHADIKDNSKKTILLEECLEHYFNDSVQVKRQLERRLSMRRPNPIPSVSEGSVEDLEKSQTEHIENLSDGDCTDSSLGSPASRGVVTYSEDVVSPSSLTSKVLEKSPEKQHSRRYSLSKENYHVSTRSRANSTVSIFSESKNGEVSLPAWMFLQLLPFYTDLEPNSQTEKSFAEKRPILPICLKSYTFDKSSQKSSKKVIIPPFISLPNFIADEDQNEDHEQEPNHSAFRLVLESVVCHRGSSINSGHFVSIVRDEPYSSNSTEEEEENKRWLLFDDLSDANRVNSVTFKEAFAKESPYILFYRMERVVNEDNNKGPSDVSYSADARNKTTNNGSVDSCSSLSKNNSSEEVKSDDLHENKKTDAEQSKKIDAEQLKKADPEDRKKNDTEDRKRNESHSSSHLLSKMVFHGSTHPYPTSSEYVEIKNRYYWKIRTKDGFYLEETKSNVLNEKATSKRNSWLEVLENGSEVEDGESLSMSYENIENQEDKSKKSSMWGRRLSLRKKSKPTTSSDEKPTITVLPSSRENEKDGDNGADNDEEGNNEKHSNELSNGERSEIATNSSVISIGSRSRHLSPVRSLISSQSPRSSYEGVRSNQMRSNVGEVLSLAHSKKSELQVTPSKSSLRSRHKRANDLKLKKEIYRKEKCLIM